MSYIRIEKNIRTFYFIFSIVLLWGCFYDAFIIAWFNIEVYLHLQYLLANLIYLSIIFFLIKRKKKINFYLINTINTILLIIFLLEIIIGVCNLMNALTYLFTNEIELLMEYRASFLEDTLIPFYKSIFSTSVDCSHEGSPPETDFQNSSQPHPSREQNLPIEAKYSIKGVKTSARTVKDVSDGITMTLGPLALCQGLGGTPVAIAKLPPVAKGVLLAGAAVTGVAVIKLTK